MKVLYVTNKYDENYKMNFSKAVKGVVGMTRMFARDSIKNSPRKGESVIKTGFPYLYL